MAGPIFHSHTSITTGHRDPTDESQLVNQACVNASAQRYYTMGEWILIYMENKAALRCHIKSARLLSRAVAEHGTKKTLSEPSSRIVTYFKTT
jgi:hypothetical protein